MAQRLIFDPAAVGGAGAGAGAAVPAGSVHALTGPADPGNLSILRVARSEFASLNIQPAQSPLAAAFPLQRINGYFRSREAIMARQLQNAVARRDGMGLVIDAEQMQDLALEEDLASKAIAKSISGIDQLTRMN